MAGAISVSRNRVIERKFFSVLAAIYWGLDSSDLGPSLDANGHQSLF